MSENQSKYFLKTWNIFEKLLKYFSSKGSSTSPVQTCPASWGARWAGSEVTTPLTLSTLDQQQGEASTEASEDAVFLVTSPQFPPSPPPTIRSSEADSCWTTRVCLVFSSCCSSTTPSSTRLVCIAFSATCVTTPPPETGWSSVCCQYWRRPTPQSQLNKTPVDR